MSLVVLPRQVIVDANGAPRVAAQLAFYQSGTNTPITVYTTGAYSVAHQNPVESLGSGFFPSIYINPSVNATYKLVALDANGASLYTEDNIPAEGTQLRSDLASSVTSSEGASLVGAKYAATGAVALNLQEYLTDDGAYNVMGFIPQNLKSAIRAGTSTADVSAYLQACFDAASADQVNSVKFRAGLYRIETALALSRGLNITGSGQYRTILGVVGAINGLTYTGTLGNPDGAKLTLSDFTVKGSSSSLPLVSFVTAGQLAFNRMRFWLSNDSLVKLATECHEATFLDCQFRSWRKHAVQYSGLNSIQNFIGTNVFNILGGDSITQDAGSSCIYFGDGEQFNVRGCNVNGDETLNHFVRFGATNAGPEGNTRGDIIGNYCERLAGSAIKSDSTVIAHGLEIARNNLSCADSIAIDLSAGNPTHRRLIIEANRRAETTACFVASLGSGVVDFRYAGVLLSGSADHLVGFTGQTQVQKFADTTLHVGSQTRSTIGPFSFDNVSGTTGNTDMSGVRWVAPRAGRVTGVVVKATEARTAGTLTVNVFKNTGLSGASGSAMGVSADLDGTNTISKATTTNTIDSTRSFAAGDEVYLRYSTSGWTPTTSDIRGFIEVEM